MSRAAVRKTWSMRAPLGLLLALLTSVLSREPLSAKPTSAVRPPPLRGFKLSTKTTAGCPTVTVCKAQPREAVLLGEPVLLGLLSLLDVELVEAVRALLALGRPVELECSLGAAGGLGKLLAALLALLLLLAVQVKLWLREAEAAALPQALELPPAPPVLALELPEELWLRL